MKKIDGSRESGSGGRDAGDADGFLERARRGRIALILSLALNFIGVLLFWRLFVLPREPAAHRSQTEIVTITRKRQIAPIVVEPRVARIPPKPRVQVKPRPVVAAAPAPAAVAPHRTLHPQPPHGAPHRAELAKNGGGSHAAARTDVTSPGTVAAKRPMLGAQKIAQIERDLQGEIDADRDAHAPLAVAAAPAPTMKHFAADLGDLTTGAVRGHGLCDPTRDWKADGFDYYYVACNVKFTDGTFQRQDVPWPVRFPPSDDPFTGTAHQTKPLAMPLPGWHLPPGETVSDELRAYARDHGVEI